MTDRHQELLRIMYPDGIPPDVLAAVERSESLLKRVGQVTLTPQMLITLAVTLEQQRLGVVVPETVPDVDVKDLAPGERVVVQDGENRRYGEFVRYLKDKRVEVRIEGKKRPDTFAWDAILNGASA